MFLIAVKVLGDLDFNRLETVATEIAADMEVRIRRKEGVMWRVSRGFQRDNRVSAFI